jgi:hypothetical protein
MTTEHRAIVIAEIEMLQAIQGRNHPESIAWKMASKALNERVQLLTGKTDNDAHGRV